MLTYQINPNSATPENDQNTIRINATETSTQLLAANTARKSITFYSYSNKPCFISANSSPATTSGATTPNFKWLIPAEHVVAINHPPTNSLQVIFEAGATGFLLATEGF